MLRFAKPGVLAEMAGGVDPLTATRNATYDGPVLDVMNREGRSPELTGGLDSGSGPLPDPIEMAGLGAAPPAGQRQFMPQTQVVDPLRPGEREMEYATNNAGNILNQALHNRQVVGANDMSQVQAAYDIGRVQEQTAGQNFLEYVLNGQAG